MKRGMLRMASAALLAAMLAACAAMHPPEPSARVLPDHAPLISNDLPESGTWPGSQWWRVYQDPVLDALVELAISNGPDIANADARIQLAGQEARVAGAALGLKVNANFGYSRQRLSDNGLLPPEFLGYHWYGQSDLGVAMRYQFDWWGKQQALIEAAIDRSRAVTAERQAAALMLAASVAEAYFGWQADSARAVLTRQSIALQSEIQHIILLRVGAQLEHTDRAIEARMRLAGLHEQLQMLEGSRRLRIVTLGALLGVDAQAIPALTGHDLPQVSGQLPADAGTNLLARRPDIAASRWRVDAALRDTDSRRAAFFPDISLQALAGLSSVELGKLLESGSRVPRFGIAIDLPLFDAGMRRAQHDAAEARLDVAVATYQEAVINAAREAGMAAASLQQIGAARPHRQAQLAAASELAGRIQARLDRGLTTRDQQLTARIAEFEQQDQLVQLDLAAVLADVQLKQALAGDPAPRSEAP